MCRSIQQKGTRAFYLLLALYIVVSMTSEIISAALLMASLRASLRGMALDARRDLEMTIVVRTNIR